MQVLCVVHLLLLYASTNSTNSLHSINLMASQRPARDIIRQDYHAIVNYKNDKPAHLPTVTAPFWTVTVDIALDSLRTHTETQTRH
jgi:hypothetical protein